MRGGDCRVRRAVWSGMVRGWGDQPTCLKPSPWTLVWRWMVYSRATTSVRAERVLRSVFFCPRAIVEAVRACVRGWMGGQGRRQGSVSRKNEGCTQQRVVRGPSSARPAPTRPSRPVPPVAQAHLAPLCCGTVTASRQPRRRAWPGGTRRGGAIFATPATRARAGGAGRDKGEDGAGEALHEPECGTEAHVGVLSEEREGPEEKPGEARRGEEVIGWRALALLSQCQSAHLLVCHYSGHGLE